MDDIARISTSGGQSIGPTQAETSKKPSERDLQSVDSKVSGVAGETLTGKTGEGEKAGTKHVPEKGVQPSHREGEPVGISENAPEQVKNAGSNVKAKVSKQAIMSSIDSPKAKALFGTLKTPQTTRDDSSISQPKAPPQSETGKVRSHEAPPNFRAGSVSESARQKLLEGGADLKTAQGPKAEELSYRVGTALVANAARKENVTFAEVAERGGVKSPEKQFEAVINVVDEFIGGEKGLEALKDNEGINAPLQGEQGKPPLQDADMLNGLVGLMHKGFNGQTGGVGSFAGKGWNPKWNNIKFEQGNAEHNKEMAKDLKDMLKFYKDNAPAHFGNDRHVAGRELASVQTACTVGQIVNDFVANKAFTEESREKLVSKMEDTGLIHDTMKPKEKGGSPDQLLSVQERMRHNPLLAEVENSAIIDDISTALETGKNKEQMLNLIKDELRSLDTEHKLDETQLDDLANKVYKNYTDRVKGMKPQTAKTGARGRLPFDTKLNPALGGLGKTLAGDKGVKYSMADQPNRANDEFATETTKNRLGATDPQIRRYFEATEENGQNILKHGGSPLVPLRLGSGLDSEVASVLDPTTLLKDAIQDVAKEESGDSQSVLNGLAENVGGEKFKKGYQDIVGNFDITFNGAPEDPKPKIKLQKFAEMDSVASIMYKNDIRTICSISGTTVDVVTSQVSVMGEAQVKELLQPLLNHVEGKDPGLNSPEGEKFKEFATAIGAFMQTGKYHTMGEVVGGLYIAARSMNCSKEDNQDIDTTFKQFSGLMEEFSADPTQFMAVSDSDKEAIEDGRSVFTNQLAAVEQSRIQERVGTSREL